MGSDFRSYLKRNVPAGVKAWVGAVRDAVEPPPIDDTVLARYVMAEDGSDRVRVNLVVPNLETRLAFGGIMTGIDILFRLAVELDAKTPTDVRIIIAEPDRNTDTAFVKACARQNGLAGDRLSYFPLEGRQNPVPVRRKDLFVTFNWWTTLNTQHLLDQQAAHFGCKPRPLVYLIQEYEAQIFPFSSAHMLCREAYDRTPRLWGVFNSSNLHDYFGKQGHKAERAFTFEPVINDKLRPFLDRVATSNRQKRILVYGRPQIRRNCFPALLRGMREWANAYPEYADWEVISAGTAHKPVALGDGRSIRSVGKLSLEDYAQMLLSSSVGVSLMASPHPSYPPLEMAHLGLRTVTNTYLCKDLSGFHPNIISVGSMSEGALAAAIASACEQAGTSPHADSNPDYIRTKPYPFMDELPNALLAELASG